MHVHQHMPSLPNLNNAQARKTAPQEESGVFAQVSNGTGDGASRGRRQPSNRRGAQPMVPTTSGLLRPRLAGQGKLAPFMAVTSVTEFWTELVMADSQTATPEAASNIAPSDMPTLLDLFAEAVK